LSLLLGFGVKRIIAENHTPSPHLPPIVPYSEKKELLEIEEEIKEKPLEIKEEIKPLEIKKIGEKPIDPIKHFDSPKIIENQINKLLNEEDFFQEMQKIITNNKEKNKSNELNKLKLENKNKRIETIRKNINSNNFEKEKLIALIRNLWGKKEAENEQMWKENENSKKKS